MSLKDNIVIEANKLSVEFPFFATYSFNKYHAPHLNGGSSVDMGIVFMIIKEMGIDANCPKLSSLLCVTELTCKNWIGKLREDCLCQIEWQNNSRTGKQFVVGSMGIFNTKLYSNFRPYVKLLIRHWRDINYGKKQ
jgi:hypothetical protein